MDLEEQQLVIKWRSLGELREKLKSILGDLEANASVTKAESSEKVPKEVEELGLNGFSAIMLTALRESHLGKDKAVSASQLATEMKKRYPIFFSKKDLGEIAHGTIFPGKQMTEAGYIKMALTSDPESPDYSYRVYWVE